MLVEQQCPHPPRPLSSSNRTRFSRSSHPTTIWDRSSLVGMGHKQRHRPPVLLLSTLQGRWRQLFLQCLHWLRSSRNLGCDACVRVVLTLALPSLERSTISPMVRTLTASPLSVLVFRSMNLISASSSASSRPALLGSGNLPLGCFRTKRWRCLVSGLRKCNHHFPPL